MVGQFRSCRRWSRRGPRVVECGWHNACGPGKPRRKRRRPCWRVGPTGFGASLRRRCTSDRHFCVVSMDEVRKFTAKRLASIVALELERGAHGLILTSLPQFDQAVFLAELGAT